MIVQGVSEGGLIGPLAFPSYMDTLTRDLEKAGCGVGLGIELPACWQSVHWHGKGTPCAEATADIVRGLRGGKTISFS